jgi:hypothetical protein
MRDTHVFCKKPERAIRGECRVPVCAGGCRAADRSGEQRARSRRTTKNNVASFALAGDTYTPTGNKTIVGVKLVNPTVGYDYKLRYQNSSGTVLWQTRVNAVTTSETLSRPLPTDVVKINIDAHGVYWDPGYTTTTAILYQEQ